MMLAAIDTARARGAHLVWTIHNLRAHGRRHPTWEAAFREQFLRRLDGVIALTKAGLDAARSEYPSLRNIPAAVVAHPHYRGLYEDQLSRSEARKRLGLPQDARVLAFVGRVAAYKGVSELVSAFQALQDRDARLLIAGAPFSAEDRAAMARYPELDARIHVHPQFVPDDELQLYLRASNLVALPFRDILNSGSALLALSFDRPVLAPARGAIVELAELAGTTWVQTYEGALTAAMLGDALSQVEGYSDHSDGRQLLALEPASIARETAAAYRQFIAESTRHARSD
jgi:glycosyltransferase involved in cell wall biosynthesis